MAEPVGALRLELSASIAKFEADLGKARQAARNFSTGVNKSLKDMGGGFGGLGSQIGKMAASFAIATVAVNAISSAIRGTTGFIKDSISASATQTTQEKTLAKAIENTGVSYASVRDQINQTLVTIQRSTKFADDEQRPVLQTLIALTGDYKTSLKALPTVLDASVALQQDAKATALLFAKAIAGNISSLSRYGITLDETTQKLIKQATPAEALELLTKALGDRWKGLAESEAADFEGQLIQLTNAWGDLKETIGDFITKSPQVQDAINKIEDRIFDWIEAIENNEETQKKFNEFLDNAIGLMDSLATAIPKAVEKLKDFFGILSDIKFVADNFNFEALSKALDVESFGQLFTTTPGDVLKKFKEQIKLMQDAQKQVEFYDKSLQNLAVPLGIDIDRLDDLGLVLGNATEKTTAATKATEKHTDAAKKGKSAIEQLNDSFKKQVETLEKQVATFGLTAEQIIEFDRQLAISKGVIPEVANRVADLSLELNDLEEAAKDTAEAWEELFSMDEEIDALQEELDQIDFQAFLDKTEPQLDSFAEFVGSTFANVAQDIANAFLEAKSVMEAVINAGKRLLADLISFALVNPIRIAVETAFGGGGVAGGGIGAIGGGLLSGGGGFNLGSILGSIGGLFSGIVESFRSLGSLLLGEFAGLTGLLGTINAALPAIGVIVAAITIIVPLIQKLLKKTPRLDIDIPRINKAIKENIDTTVEMFAMFDELPKEIQKILIAVGTKGGVEDAIKGSEVREAIADVIQATIKGIQDVIALLPKEMADKLNEMLLKTKVDAEEHIKGGVGKLKILELDVSSGFKKKLEAFFKGIPGLFILSIREFFEDALTELGVQADAAKKLIADKFAEYLAIEGQSPEAIAARAKIGEEILLTFGAFVDAFNILNDNAADSFQAAINQIEAISEELGIMEGGVPTLSQLKEALQALFEAGEITPEILEKFLALKDAIIVFDQAVDDMFDKISQFGKGATELAFEGIREMTEELGIQTRTGIPSLKELTEAFEDLIGTTDITKEALRELVESGKITPEIVDKFIALRQAIMDLSFSLSQSIQSILRNIQQLNQQIFDLGGDIVPTSEFIREQIAILLGMYNQEGLTIEERIAILDQLNALGVDLNNAFIQENTLMRERIEKAQNMIAAITNEIAAVNAHIDALRIQKQRIEETFKVRIAGLEEEKKLISEIASERIKVLEDEKSAIQSAFGLREEEKYAIIEQLNLLQELRTQVEADFNERIQLAEQEHKTWIDLSNDRLKLSIDGINSQIDALEDLVQAAERFKDLVGTISDDILQVKLVGKVPEQQIDIIRSLISLEEAMLRRLQGEAKLGSLEKLRDLNLQLFKITQGAFQEPSLEFQAMQTEIIRNLEDLQNVAEREAAKAIDIQARIASLNEHILLVNSEIESNTNTISLEAVRLREEQEQQLAAIDTQIADLTIEAQERIEEVTLELEKLRREEAEALASIDAQIAELERQQAAALASIDAQIAQANQHLVALNAQLQTQNAILTQQATLTEEQQAELRAFLEFLREQQLELLDERIRQQAELSGLLIATFKLDVQRNTKLAELAGHSVAQTQASYQMLNQLIRLNANIGGIASMQTGGLVRSTGLKLLHAGEFVLPSDFSGGSTRNVHIDVNVNGNIPSNPVAINMLSNSLVSKIKEEIVQDMEYGKLGKVTVRRVGLA